jgi:MOSC domain-containing protein YiiM
VDAAARASFAACLASVLGVPAAAVPVPPEGDDPWLVWRQWLAGRGLGLVPVHAPGDFSLPGHWIGRGAGADAWSVLFGVPSGVVGGAPLSAPVAEGWVVTSLTVRLPEPPRVDAAGEGVVVAIGVAREARAPVVAVERVRAVPGRGLEGDRYAAGTGTFSRREANGRNLTIVAAEALDALAAEGGPVVEPLAARRNLVVRGVDLDALVGRRFAVGEVVCEGRRRCEPCAHLERVLGTPSVLRGLVHRGGLRADVVEGGELAVGDPVRAL